MAKNLHSQHYEKNILNIYFHKNFDIVLKFNKSFIYLDEKKRIGLINLKFLSKRFPFYYEIKIILVLWLLSPATKGSSILYRRFVHPALSRREAEIDDALARATEQGYTAVLHLGTRGVNYATTVLMQTAIKVCEKIYIFRPVFSSNKFVFYFHHPLFMYLVAMKIHIETLVCLFLLVSFVFHLPYSQCPAPARLFEQRNIKEKKKRAEIKNQLRTL